MFARRVVPAPYWFCAVVVVALLWATLPATWVGVHAGFVHGGWVSAPAAHIAAGRAVAPYWPVHRGAPLLWLLVCGLGLAVAVRACARARWRSTGPSTGWRDTDVPVYPMSTTGDPYPLGPTPDPTPASDTDLNAAVWAEVGRLLGDPAPLAARPSADTLDDVPDTAAGWHAHLADLEEEDRRLLDAFQTGDLALGDLAARRRQIAARRHAVLTQQEEQAHARHARAIVADLLEARMHIETLLSDATVADKQALVQALTERNRQTGR